MYNNYTEFIPYPYKGLVTNYGERRGGGGGGGGAGGGAETVIAVLKGGGGGKKFCGSFYAVA